MGGRWDDAVSALAVSRGDAVAGGANNPIELTDARTAWFVERGALDVFVVERRDGRVASTFKHVVRAEAGRIVFGADPAADGAAGGGAAELLLVAKGTADARLRRVPLSMLSDDALRDGLAERVDAWVAGLSAAVVRDVTLRPASEQRLDAGAGIDVEADGAVSAHGGVVWADPPRGGAAFLDVEDADGDVPLTPDSWLRLRRGGRLRGTSTRDLAGGGRLFRALEGFHRLALNAELVNRRLLAVDEANLQAARTTLRRENEQRARRRLAGVLQDSAAAGDAAGPRDAAGTAALRAALDRVGAHEGIVFRPPSRRRGSAGAEPSLADILHASGVRGRRVRLSSGDRWWRGDSGAMLGFRKDGRRPVALLPGAGGRYVLADPAAPRPVRVNPARARTLCGDAWFFYRPLPDGARAGGRGLFRVTGPRLAADLARFAAAGLLSGVLTLAPAIVVGLLADHVLPVGAERTLAQLAILLAGLALAGAGLHILQGMSLLRLEGRAAARIGAAIQDRLLRLPTRFFDAFTSGDLMARATIFQTLRDQLSGIVANAFLSVVFLLPTFGLLFFYDAGIGWLSLAMGAVSLAVTAGLGLVQIGPRRRVFARARQLGGRLLEFIEGIAKLRTTGAEGSAFADWAHVYRQQKRAELKIGAFNDHLVAFSTAAPALVGAALCGLALGAENLAVGDFLAAYAASMIFYSAVLRFGDSFSVVAAVLPAVEQVRPLLAAAPDDDDGHEDPPPLRGEVRFDRVSFRYDENGPLILDDVSMHVEPGQFVAVVGGSGAGKSTLLRLALGLAAPSSGAVYYDGRDLARLDKGAVRRQIGVVVQDTALDPGRLLDNIIGVSAALDIDDAWRAARLAAVDRDIAAMPMGMHTGVVEGAGAFSGGQVQRIKVAAALVRKPRVLFLDEATNWLDARTQDELMKGIASVAATRIVVAHRLSTIRQADRIYVLDGGRVVQQGRFEELVEVDGVFRNLVRRQMA